MSARTTDRKSKQILKIDNNNIWKEHNDIA